MLAPGRVGVDPRDRLVERRADADPHVAEAHLGRARPGLDRHPRAHPAEHPGAAVGVQRAVRHPGRRRRPDLHAPDRHVEPRVGRAVEADPVQPQPALGVLRAPVVPDHPGPAVELQPPPVRLDAARHARRGSRALELRARQRGGVEPRVGEVAQRRRRVVHGQVPGRRVRPGGRPAADGAGPEARARDLDPVPGHSDARASP